MERTIDPYFRVEVLSQTANPQQVIYAALHQDYSEAFVWDEREKFPDEKRAGEIAVKQLLAGQRHHWGPLEHPQIVFNCGWFPHSVMQQLRTHRIGVSADCQSLRYTGKRIFEAGKHFEDTGSLEKIEEVFYLRPIGEYTDREGGRYEYGEDWRNEDLMCAAGAAIKYADDIERGKSEEHARGLIPFDVRQHWAVSFNMRSFCHVLGIRGKADAQLEIQQLCELMLPHFQAWAPEIYGWFMANQWKKGRLAP